MSVDPFNASNERFVDSEIHNPLSNAENLQITKCNERLSKLSSLHAKYNLNLGSHYKGVASSALVLEEMDYLNVDL
ncbi:hypothetical protein P9112_007314 [Eukaryota sp. TZLM1-RC]